MTVWTSVPVTGFATGTGTDATALQTLTVPSNAHYLVSIKAEVHSTAPAPAESLTGIVSLTGLDWQNSDYQFFTEIGGSHLGAINGNPYYQSARFWKAYQPVTPNSQIGVTYEPLDAEAGNGFVQILAKWSDTDLGKAPVNRKATTETSTSTSTIPSLTLSGCQRITELTFAVSSSTISGDDPASYILEVNSGNLVGQQTIQAIANLHGIEATSGQEVTYLNQNEVSIDVNRSMTNSVTFNGTVTESVALGTAGQYAYSIGYNRTA